MSMVMLLSGRDGSEFELGLIEERLAEIQDGFGDSAAVTITFRVATPDESWEETSPCFNLYEVENLAEWLEAVSDRTIIARDAPDEGEEAEVDLLEPELNFAVVRDMGEDVVLRISFHLEDRPEEFEVDAPTDEATHIDLRLSRDALRIAAAQLRDGLERLGRPGRAGASGAASAADKLRDDLLGEDELAEIRVPEDDLGLGPRIVSEEDVGFGAGPDEAEEARMQDEDEERGTGF